MQTLLTTLKLQFAPVPALHASHADHCAYNVVLEVTAVADGNIPLASMTFDPPVCESKYPVKFHPVRVGFVNSVISH